MRAALGALAIVLLAATPAGTPKIEVLRGIEPLKTTLAEAGTSGSPVVAHFWLPFQQEDSPGIGNLTATGDRAGLAPQKRGLVRGHLGIAPPPERVLLTRSFRKAILPMQTSVHDWRWTLRS